MAEKFHKPVLTDSQLSGKESSSLEPLVILGALALIIASMVAFYIGYTLLITGTKVLIRLGTMDITYSLAGVMVMIISIILFTYAYKRLKKIAQL